MTISADPGATIPPYVPPYYPLPTITPFTFRDGVTYEGRFVALLHYLNTVIIPFVNVNYTNLAEEFTAQTELLINTVNSALETQDEEVDAKITELEAMVNAAVDAIINDSIVAQDPVVAGLVNSPSSATHAAIISLMGTYATVESVTALEDIVNTGRLSATQLSVDFVNAGEITTNVKDYGAIGNGVSFDTSAINSAIAATPDGGNLLIPAGTYKLDGSILITEKSITVNATNAAFVQTTGDNAVEINGTWETTQSVTTLVSTTQTIDANDLNIVKLTLASAAPAWIRGDIVRVWSDDVLPMSQTDITPAPSSAMRVGQFMTVHSVSGGDVTLIGTLRDAMTTGIKVARLSRKQVRWIGGKFSSTFSGNVMMFRMRGLRTPYVEGVTIDNARGQAFSFAGCYAYHLFNTICKWSLNDTVGGAYGYGVDDNTSEFGLVESCVFIQPRHAYTTTATPTAVGSDSPNIKGRTYGAKIVNTTCMSPIVSAFDTHSNGTSITFVNCFAVDAIIGFNLRGLNNRVVNSRGRRLNKGVRIASDSDAGESHGHIISNCVFEYVSDRVIEVAVRYGATHPNYNVKDSVANRVDNVHASGVQNSILVTLNSTVIISNCTFDVVGTSAASRQYNRIDRSTVRMTGRCTYDVGSVVAGVDLSTLFYMTDSTTLVEIERIRIISFSAFTARWNKIFGSDGSVTLRVDDLLYDYAPTGAIYDYNSNAGWVHYRRSVGSNNPSSRLATIATANVAADLINTIGNVRHDFTLELNPTSAQTLAQIPTGEYGQVLRLINISAYNITINHGTTPRTYLNGATTKTLTPNTTIYFVFDSVWRQITPIS